MASSSVYSEDEFPPDEPYEQRGGTENWGAEYEYLIPTLFAIRSIFREDIKNIWLGCNVEGLGAFDDVFLHLEYTNGKKRLYIIQLKHVRGPIKISSFTEDKNFNFHKYYESFEEIQEKSGSEGHVLYNIAAEDITFVIYTTANLNNPADKLEIPKLNFILEKVAEFEENQLLNTTATRKGHTHKFHLDKETASTISTTFLSNFYLLLNQSNVTAVKQFIHEAINAKFDHIDDNVKTNFTHYIKSMTTGSKLYQLQKHELQTKLIELILTPYIVEPNISIQMENIESWNALVDDIDIVVFQHDTTTVIAKIWSIINEKVKKHLNTTIPNSSEWLKSVNKKTRDEFTKKYKDQYLESLLRKQLRPNGTATMKLLYIVLWKAGLVPLFLKAVDAAQKNNIVKAIKLIKAIKNKKHFIVIEKDNFEDEHLKNLKVFRNAADLPEEKIAMLENVGISLQGRKNNVTLNKIVCLDENIKTTISSEVLLKMVHKTTIIGNKLEETLDYYIERRVMKAVLDVSALEKLKGSVFVICGTKQAIDDLKPSLKSYSDFNLLYLQNKISDGTEYVILTTETDTKVFEEICNFVQEKNVHKLCKHERSQNYLEWLDSKGSIEELQPFLKYNEEFSLSESELFNYTSRTTNIICANPGMGKSMLINKLALNYPADFWVIKFNLGDHIENINETNFFDYFYDNDNSKIPTQELTKALFSTLVKLRRVCIFVDGCDEVLELYFDKASQLLKYLDQEGFHLWIVGRPIVKQHLESVFNMLSLTLKPLNATDQLNFLQKYFLHKKGTEENLTQFINKTRDIISKFSNWKEDFAAVPLQIRMIAELFLNENFTTLNATDLISLYEHFIDNKLNIYWKKLYGDFPNAQLQARIKKDNKKTKIQHMHAALTLFYQRELLETVLDYDDLDEFLQDIKTGTENVGIITEVNEKLEATFEHRSFAEYLAAKWLSEQCKKKKISEFLFRIFERDFREVRQFFDRLLSVDCPLHSAIFNCDNQKVKKLLSNPKSVELEDQGGRTALHLVASWSTRHVFPQNYEANNMHINTQQHYTEEPLFYNCKNILQKLLTQARISPLQEDKLLGWTALDYANHTGCLDSIEEISSHLPDVDLTNLSIFCYKNSLLYYSARYAYVNIFKAVTEHPHIFNELNQNLMHTAAINGNSNILKHMLDEYRQTYVDFVNAEDEHKCTSLYYASNGPSQTSNNNKHADYGEFVQMLIKENAEINARDKYGYIPLHAAAYYGSFYILKLLILSGSSINHSSQRGTTPLHHAALNGHTKCILELAHNNANLNELNVCGRTPIHYAALLGHIETLRALLELKADINKCDDEGLTPLHVAAISQHVDCVKALISEGADVNFTSTGSLSPLYISAKLGNKAIVKILIKAKADVNLGKEMSTPLHIAAFGGHLDCVRSLIGNKAKVNAKNSEGTTPLHEAAREGHINVLKFVIKSRAIVNCAANNGVAPLHLAIEMGHFDCVQDLIANNADVNIRANNGITPLSVAAHTGRLDILNLLIQAKVMINLPTPIGTPLHLACISGHMEVAYRLIKKGAIVNVKNNLGITPLHLAAKQGHYKLIDILIKADKEQRLKDTAEQSFNNLTSSTFINQLTNSGESPLALAILDGHTECVRKLILNNVDIKQNDSEGCSPLFSAVSYGYINIVRLLIESGAPVDEDVAFFQPLCAAIVINRMDIIKLLVEHKANVNVKCESESEMTALHLAVYRGYGDIVKYLVINGASVTKKTCRGKTSLDLAIDMYSSDHEISYFLNQNINKF